MYLPLIYKIFYNTEEFSFREIVSEMLQTQKLENLHTLYEYHTLTREKDQSTVWHKRYYESYDDKFLPTYIRLVEFIKQQLEYPEIIYQRIPTFRVQLGNGNVGVGEWHKDKTYNHGVSEVNFWMPFTDTNEHNTIWLESKEDRQDYRPYKVSYGEILVFNGASLYHGNQKNLSDSTRVSVDFRLVDPSRFVPNTAGSINMNTKFDIGGYFEKL
jgi:hypothetical protein